MGIQSIFDQFKSMNPSVEHLVGLLIEYQTSIQLLKKRFATDEEKLTLLELCEHRIDEAKKALAGRRFYHRKKVFVAWDLFHQVNADMILFMGPQELAATGRKLVIDIKTSSLASTAKTDWTLQLEEALKRLSVSEPSVTETEYARHMIRTVTFTLNTHVDTLFWDIWTKKFLGFIYTILLLSHLFLFLSRCKEGLEVTDISNVALVGVMGGLLSGIFTGEPQFLAKGHFWFSTFYQSLVRPVQGAVAAILMFWMLESQYLIKINPALSPDTSVVASSSLAPASLASYQAIPPGCDQAGPTLLVDVKQANNDRKSCEKDAMLVFNAAEGKQRYLYLLILLIAGFTGDKLLKSVSDKVTSRLYADAEKTKEVK